MVISFLQRHRFTRDFVFRLGKGRDVSTVNHFRHYLNPKEKLLDVGSGTCNVALLLADMGYETTALDIVDLSFTPRMHPTLYNGKHMPFKDKSFDSALILTVLHHINGPEQETVLLEAKRVAKRIIVIEDVYQNMLHKYVTFFLDSLMNFEFIGHPHSNNNDAKWRAEFERLGLKIVHEKAMAPLLVLRQKMYVLEPRE